jgi:phosphoglycolate phosphatase
MSCGLVPYISARKPRCCTEPLIRMTVTRLAVFDCDGTLVDSAHHIVAAMGVAFADHGLTCPAADAVRRVVGLSLEAALALLVPEAEGLLHLRLAERYRAASFALRERPDHSEPLYPGARNAIALLEDAGFLLGVATGKSQRGLHAVLDRHGLRDRFVTLQTADIAAGKPHPEMLHRAMTEAGVEPAHTAMIGDTSYDMQMAANAGVVSIGVAWGYHPPAELEACGARAVAADFAALPDLVLAAVRAR